MASKSNEESPGLTLITDQFKQLHSILEQAEARVKESFDSHDLERERLILKCKSGIEEAQITKSFAENNIGDNELKIGIIRDCEKKIAQLSADKLEAEQLAATDVIWSDLGFEMLKLKLSSINFATRDNLKMPDLTSPKYSGGIISEVSREGGLIWPNHLAIEEETGNIYISDFEGDCIQIFDKNAGFLKIFARKLTSPRAILIRESKLYVIENRVAEKFIRFKIFSIKEEKILTSHKGVVGPDMGQIGIAGSFDVTTDGKWYISEPDNYRVQILKSNLMHHSFFSPSTDFKRPIQIRIKHNDVYVLDRMSIKILSLSNEILLNSIDLPGVADAMYFAVGPHCFVVSDYEEGCLKIFDNEGKLIHSGQQLVKPKGIEVLQNGTVISVSMTQPGHCLNIY